MRLAVLGGLPALESTATPPAAVSPAEKVHVLGSEFFHRDSRLAFDRDWSACVNRKLQNEIKGLVSAFSVDRQRAELCQENAE